MLEYTVDRDQILQVEMRDYVQNRLGVDDWVKAYEFSRNDRGKRAFFSALIPNSKVSEALADCSWDLGIRGGQPSIFESPSATETRYLRFGNRDGIEPLVLYRDFHGIRPYSLEVAEEFRLFHNLYYDSKTGRYSKIDDNGDEEDVAIVDADSARIRLRDIRLFLSAKKMHLALNFQIDQTSRYVPQELGLQEAEEVFTAQGLIYRFSVRKIDWGEVGTFSTLLGKKLVPGLDESDLTPAFKTRKEYVDFIIGVDKDSKPISHTCDPERLANYFGANPGEPHYLKPVFFRREVLSKYYSNPGKYSVEDGYLRCKSLWGLKMDNNQERHVVVFLGDLGRDLSFKEQLYWRSFNLFSQESISNVSRRRNFLADFEEPEKADLVFKSAFLAFQEKWHEKLGWFLFKLLSDADAYSFQKLHIPVCESQSEFDEQVLALSRLLIDSLNEKEIRMRLRENIPGGKSITKFEAFLKEHNRPNWEPHTTFLRNLYDLRHGAGHRKGETFTKAATSFGLEEKGFIVAFTEILNHAHGLLLWLEANFC